MKESASELNRASGPSVYSELAPRVLYAFIAVTAFLSNMLLCVVLIKSRRQMLKKPYNILILNLAVTDMLTGKLK